MQKLQITMRREVCKGVLQLRGCTLESSEDGCISVRPPHPNAAVQFLPKDGTEGDELLLDIGRYMATVRRLMVGMCGSLYSCIHAGWISCQDLSLMSVKWCRCSPHERTRWPCLALIPPAPRATVLPAVSGRLAHESLRTVKS